MDPRKIQFLIAMQREIDKVEAREGETSTRVERLKSRFYDVVEVADVVGDGKILQTSENNSQNDSIHTSLPEVSSNITSELEYWTDFVDSLGDDISELAVSKEDIQKLLQDETFQNNEPEELIAVRKNPAGQKKTVRLQSVELTKKFPHKPKDVAAFLDRFRDKENRGLKYLTHDWSDASKEKNHLRYDEVIKNAINEFWECIKQYKVPYQLRLKLTEFIVTKSTDKLNESGKPENPHFYYNVIKSGRLEQIHVYSGWSSNEMIEWVKNNPESDPNCDDYWIKNLITPFKNIIEIRRGMLDQYFRDYVSFVYEKEWPNFSPVFCKTLKSARFFTDVPMVFGGIRQLLESSKTYAKEEGKEPYLSVSYAAPATEDTEFALRQLIIVTDLDAELLYDKNFLTSGGNFGKACNYFRGLCNWSILCKRDDSYLRLNLLSDVDVPDEQSVTAEEVGGLTHILTFYGQ